jgi:flagellar hook protein FlgE
MVRPKQVCGRFMMGAQSNVEWTTPMSMTTSAITGLQVDENWLSGISQNVANSTTTGFKTTTTDFDSLVDQVGQPKGIGVSARSSVAANSQCSIVSGFSPTNLTIQGNGFFVVSDTTGNTFLTRDGSFSPDASGNLVNASGYYLMGASVNGSYSPSDLQTVNVVQPGSGSSSVADVIVGSNGVLSFAYSNGLTIPAYSLPLANVESPDNLTAVNGTVFSPNANSGQAQIGLAGTGGLGTISTSSLESSTTNLTSALTLLIQAQASYQFNSQVFQTGDKIVSGRNNLGE